ncbi:MAG: MFS transporter [Roseibium sp.]
MSDTSADATFPEKYGIEWWYTAHLVYGAIQLIFIPILVPTFALEVTGSATMAGAAMAIIGLGGLLAPIIGGLADQYRAHREAQLAGLAAYAVAGLLFAFFGQSTLGIFGGAAFMGVGSATLLMINPAFVVAGGFEPDDEAIRLTRLNQMMIIGSLIAGVGLSSLISMGLPFPGRFITLSVLAVFGFVVAFLTNKKAAGRIKVDAGGDENDGDNTKNGGVIPLLLSPFGLFLLAVFFVTTGQGAITGQAANFMQDVFTIDAGTTSLALSASGLVSLLILDAVGRMMGKSGPSPIWIGAVILKVVIMIVLIAMAWVNGIWAALPLGAYILYLQAITCVDMVQPALAARGSSAGAGLTQGLLMFAIASAYAAGSFISGISADAFGFSSLPWVVGVVSAIALVLGFIGFANMKKAAD